MSAAAKCLVPFTLVLRAYYGLNADVSFIADLLLVTRRGEARHEVREMPDKKLRRGNSHMSAGFKAESCGVCD